MDFLRDIFGYLTGTQQAKGVDVVPQVATQFGQNLATAGLSDLYHGIQKAFSPEYRDASILEKVSVAGDRAFDPGGLIDPALRGVGEVLPQEIRDIAPTAGGVIGSIISPYGAGIGAGVGSKLQGSSYSGGLMQSGIAAGSAYLGGALGDVIPTSSINYTPGMGNVPQFVINPSTLTSTLAQSSTPTIGALVGDIGANVPTYAMQGSIPALQDAMYSNMFNAATKPGAEYAMTGSAKKVAEYATPYEIGAPTSTAGIDIVKAAKDLGRIGKALAEERERPAQPIEDMIGGQVTTITPEMVQMRRMQDAGISSASKPKSLYPDWTFDTKKAWSGLDLTTLMKLQNWLEERKDGIL